MRSQLGTQARRQVDRRSLGANVSFVQLGGMFCDAESHTIHVYYRAHKIESVRGKIIKTGIGVGLNRAVSTFAIAMKLSGRR